MKISKQKQNYIIYGILLLLSVGLCYVATRRSVSTKEGLRWSDSLFTNEEKEQIDSNKLQRKILSREFNKLQRQLIKNSNNNKIKSAIEKNKKERAKLREEYYNLVK